MSAYHEMPVCPSCGIVGHAAEQCHIYLTHKSAVRDALAKLIQSCFPAIDIQKLAQVNPLSGVYVDPLYNAASTIVDAILVLSPTGGRPIPGYHVDACNCVHCPKPAQPGRKAMDPAETA